MANLISSPPPPVCSPPPPFNVPLFHEMPSFSPITTRPPSNYLHCPSSHHLSRLNIKFLFYYLIQVRCIPGGSLEVFRLFVSPSKFHFIYSYPPCLCFYKLFLPLVISLYPRWIFLSHHFFFFPRCEHTFAQSSSFCSHLSCYLYAAAFPFSQL